jgi:hypothetical protein
MLTERIPGIFLGGSGLGECMAGNKIPGIRAGTPFTRYLRGWIRDPRWWVRWPLGAVILGTIAVVVIGGIWLGYHLTAECLVTDGIGCA